jgi:NodT family efflux transporter outer membrane factor (OMF) lipoprotein
MLAAAALAACASTPLPPEVPLQAAPAHWQAQPTAPMATLASPSQAGSLPHQGSLDELLGWWRQQGDPLLVELIVAGQQVSPTVAAARARLVQAWAARVGADAALLPSLEAGAALSRSRSLTQPGAPAAAMGSASLGLQTAWEIDLFGGARAGSDAAAQRLLGAQADWHEARVSMAAEVAVQYELLRQCRRLADISARDAASRAETARLTERSRQAGFTAPASAALARASAAEAAGRALQQRGQCELDVKALVALTALPEPELRLRLARMPAAEAAGLPPLALHPIPAQALAQRPDIYSAERALQAARADIASADAQRYPRLALSGQVGGAALRGGGAATEALTWSLGPLSLSLPLLDGGRRAAQVSAAQARYEDAAVQYAARVRQAVREVEAALVHLQSTAERGPQAQAAVAGWREALQGVEARYRAGLASLFEFEDARRQLLAAEFALSEWQTQARAAHVSLYRAVGGGWSPALLADAPVR